MQRKFLQEKSLNSSTDNAEKSLNVDLSAKSRLIPFSETANMLGLNDLYTEERNACENYRMIFTVNPICSNILYNAVTEPVYKEGSEEAINLVQSAVRRNNEDVFPNGTLNMSGDSVDQIAAVRDTEYSHEKIGNFKYHCGFDIFNNHLLRSSEFEHTDRTEVNKKEFNTIEDYAIDYNGDLVMRVVNESAGPLDNPQNNMSKVRLYSLDNLKTMSTAFYDGLRVVDGWYGFYNTGYINIPNGKLDNKDVYVNRVLNNETPCGFIDMYPDRSLYSFIPKVNRFRRRLERNWDCAIVYPFENDYDRFKILNDGNEAGAVKVLSTDIFYDNVGNEQIKMFSLLRHTLNNGDQIRLFYKGGPTGKLTRYSVPVTVIGIGDEKSENAERCFKIKLSDINTFCTVREEGNVKKLVLRSAPSEEIMFYYKKIENGCDDRYYFRKFKKIKNHQYVQMNGEYSGADLKVLSKIPPVVTDKSPKHIKIGGEYFEREDNELLYTQNKIAFAGNIYGDRVAQVIFNDDICVSGLKDNLGRPLSTVYFTAIKTNRGYKKWYEEGIAADDSIEYSHCFGDITSGLDLPSGVTDYNVRKLHNVFKDDLEGEDYSAGLNRILENAPTGDYYGTPMPLESKLTMDTFDEFYGDIVEFSRANFTETVIEKVYHRFNTAQRECVKNPKYFDINYDELVGDIYDLS